MNDLGNPKQDIVLMADPRVASVPVRESRQELADVRDHGFLVSSYLADPAGEYARLRVGVLERLERAERALPPGLRLLFIEGYRPPTLQRRYFGEYLESLRAANPDWDDARLRMAASRYISPPDLAPHSAGAAVDITLCTSDAHELDLGTRVNASPEESDGMCYTDHPGIDAQAAANRAVLGAALSAVGLVNYPTEWWHWSYGDRYWAMATGAPAAIYGPGIPLPGPNIRPPADGAGKG